jgi:transposase
VEPVNKTQRGKSTGRKPKIFVRQLTAEEQTAVESASKSNDAFTRERARTILHSSQGLKVSEIGKKIEKEKRSILSAIKRFNTNGLACLQRGKTTGRKPKFTPQQKADILAVVNTDPKIHGKNFTVWSLPKLKEHIVGNKIVNHISIETLRQILRKGNKKYKKSRKWLFSNDPNFAKKNSKLTN